MEPSGKTEISVGNKNEDDGVNKKKRKGGAEKARDKNKKLLKFQASTCKKITSFAVAKSKIEIENKPDLQDVSKELEKSQTSPSELEEDKQSLAVEVSLSISSKTSDELESKLSFAPEPEPIFCPNISTFEDKSTPSCSIPNIQPKNDETSSNIFTQKSNDDKTESEKSVENFFVRPKRDHLESFFKFHPYQVTHDPVVQKSFRRKDGSARGWISFNEENQSLFCMVCLAFSAPKESNIFVDGFSDRKHIHQRAEEHEESDYHKKCAEAYLLRVNKTDFQQLLFSNQMKARQEQVTKRRLVMERIVDVIKLIGKRGLSYRGHSESAYSLQDEKADRGNFLEIIMLLAKYDTSLRDHVSLSIEKSSAANVENKAKRIKLGSKTHSKGRGNLVTMLSKNTINNVIDVIGSEIKGVISKEVNEAKMFSVQIDTTQDISCQDQCSVIVRYFLNDKINEKLIGIVRCYSTKGDAMQKTLLNVLTENNIQLSNCIGSSTDGAANMQGQYNGMSAKLKSEFPEHVHVWCYAHILNLVMADTTNSVINSASLFSLLNDISVFIRGSHIRMDILEDMTKHENRQKRLNTVGETRWWSKSKLLTKVFGTYDSRESSMYVTLICTLEAIESDTGMKPEVRVRAKSYKDGLLQYETILTAFVFITIYNHTTPLSNYLQTSGLDALKAYQFVQSVINKLEELRSTFEIVKEKADSFVSWIKSKLAERDAEAEVQSELPLKRLRIKKLMSDEQSQNHVFKNPNEVYKVEVFFVILDTVAASMKRRFDSDSQRFFADLSLLDPKNFLEIKKSTDLPTQIFQELSQKIIKFDGRATAENIKNEIISLASNWDNIRQSSLEAYAIEENDPEDDNEDLMQQQFSSTSIKMCSSCGNCCVCCYRLLNRYNLLTGSYSSLGLAYKYLLTLSFTQVACERNFSVLKYIKSRLRSNLGQSKLEDFMLMSSEKEILMKLDVQNIIDKVADKSNIMKSLLKY